MKHPYADELRALSRSYAAILDADVCPVRAALEDLGRGPALFAGSGGTMVLATLAARLHEWTFRQPARACTALDLRARVRLRHTLCDQRGEWQQRIQAVLYHHGLVQRRDLLTRENRAWVEQAALGETRVSRSPLRWR